MKKTIAITCLLLFLGATFSTQAQDPRKRIDMHSAAISSRGANPNVKSDRPSTDATDKTSSRGSGSGTCYVYLHNYTAYSIDIYLDGKYEGTLGAYADNYVPTGTGYTTMYGMSVGKTKEWKFNGASCSSSYDYYFYD